MSCMNIFTTETLHVFNVKFSVLELDTTNGRCEGRRDKFIQQELMHKSSMRTVRQVLTGN